MRKGGTGGDRARRGACRQLTVRVGALDRVDAIQRQVIAMASAAVPEPGAMGNTLPWEKSVYPMLSLEFAIPPTLLTPLIISLVPTARARMPPPFVVGRYRGLGQFDPSEQALDEVDAGFLRVLWSCELRSEKGSESCRFTGADAPDRGESKRICQRHIGKRWVRGTLLRPASHSKLGRHWRKKGLAMWGRPASRLTQQGSCCYKEILSEPHRLEWLWPEELVEM